MAGDNQVESTLTVKQLARLLGVEYEIVEQWRNKEIIRPCEVTKAGKERFRLKDSVRLIAALKSN